jgi:hypothetical protein
VFNERVNAADAGRYAASAELAAEPITGPMRALSQGRWPPNTAIKLTRTRGPVVRERARMPVGRPPNPRVQLTGFAAAQLAGN